MVKRDFSGFKPVVHSDGCPAVSLTMVPHFHLTVLNPLTQKKIE